MEITINGSAKEIADLVELVQNRQETNLDNTQLKVEDLPITLGAGVTFDLR